jgi:hypothetical protein
MPLSADQYREALKTLKETVGDDCSFYRNDAIDYDEIAADLQPHDPELATAFASAAKAMRGIARILEITATVLEKKR